MRWVQADTDAALVYATLYVYSSCKFQGAGAYTCANAYFHVLLTYAMESIVNKLLVFIATGTLGGGKGIGRNDYFFATDIHRLWIRRMIPPAILYTSI